MSFHIMLEDESIWYAGKNNKGQSGAGYTTTSSENSSYLMLPYTQINPTTIDGESLLGNIKKIFSGYNSYICCILTKDNKVYMCGSYQYILTTGLEAKNYTQFIEIATDIDGNNISGKIKDVCCGRNNKILMIDENGNLYDGFFNTFSINKNGFKKIETDIDNNPMPPIKYITNSSSGTYCAISEDGDMYLWGYGAYNMCANGTYTSSQSLTQVSKPRLIKEVKNVVKVSIGSQIGMCQDVNGDYWIWGFGLKIGFKFEENEFGDNTDYYIPMTNISKYSNLSNYYYIDSSYKKYSFPDRIKNFVINGSSCLATIEDENGNDINIASSGLSSEERNSFGSLVTSCEFWRIIIDEPLKNTKYIAHQGSYYNIFYIDENKKVYTTGHPLALAMDNAPTDLMEYTQEIGEPNGLPNNYRVKAINGVYVDKEEDSEENTTPTLPTINTNINNKINIKTTDRFKTLISSSMLDSSYSDSLENGYKINVGDKFERVFYKDELESIGFTLNTQSEKIKVKTKDGYKELAATDML